MRSSRTAALLQRTAPLVAVLATYWAQVVLRKVVTNIEADDLRTPEAAVRQERQDGAVPQPSAPTKGAGHAT